MYTLVVCEKPDAARRIASALGGARETRAAGGVSVFDVAYAGRDYKVCSASGHLYGVSDRTKNRSVYPVLDLEWAPIDDEKKGKGVRAARFISAISLLARGADSFIHACDYDQEGEVIGHSILEYACSGKYEKSLRARFSTLTDDEVREAFATLARPSRGLAEAGRSRHMLDFIYGVNLSRALAQSFKAGSNNKGYRNLSIGRVQGPTLAFVADRETEIRLHVPDPYWVLTADFEKNGQVVHARYEKPKVEKLAEARAIVDACTGRDGAVSQVSARKSTLRPPAPFNTGDLQREAYRLFRLSPGYTLAIAEKLYLRALISYPRTSSQKLPVSINYAKILSGLAGVSLYSQPARMLLSRGRLVPSEGPMTDPAHPAIYPTGVAPRLSGLEFKVYDLIAKRFLATFGDPAVTERTDVSINVNNHAFLAEGRAVLYDGWMALYRPYVSLEQSALPALHEGDVLANRQVAMEEKFTQPPWRYSQASLLARMEEEKIGTKATRADTIATLFKRNYVAAAKKGGGIEATDLGFAVVESMREHAPAIVSTELTRSMEEQLEGVERGEKEPADVIGYAVERLVESLATFREQGAAIGKQIGSAAAAQSDVVMIGGCPVCKKGQLRIIKSRATRKRFVGCSNYASGGCRASAPLPQRGGIRVSKTCKCGWPIVSVAFGRGRRRWNTCVNMQCPYKEEKKDRASLANRTAQP
ncbi:MAG: DNA topoisomerase I [Nitrososphaera sp.]